ncbi:hypothetical protein J2X61_001947 [Bacillus sp. 3255]|nr:hypothetical protein [Bacillus sp. 3255]
MCSSVLAQLRKQAVHRLVHSGAYAGCRLAPANTLRGG